MKALQDAAVSLVLQSFFFVIRVEGTVLAIYLERYDD